MPDPLTPEEIAALEKRWAAIHEAAHIVVAIALGCSEVDGWLISHGEADLGPLKSWTGRTRYNSVSVDRATVCMAGYVAEQLDYLTKEEGYKEGDPVDFGEWVEDILHDENAISSTDARSLPTDEGALYDLLGLTINLLQQHSEFHRKVTEELLAAEIYRYREWDQQDP